MNPVLLATIVAPASLNTELPMKWSPCTCVLNAQRIGLSVILRISAMRRRATAGCGWVSITITPSGVAQMIEFVPA